MAGIINAKVLWFSKAEVNETFDTCKDRKRLDCSQNVHRISTAENFSKGNASEVKEAVFPLSECSSCKTDSGKGPIHISMFEAGRLLTSVCLASYTAPAF